MKRLDIIILNFNGGKDILSCLSSLQLIKVPRGWRVRLLVIDNGSTDGSVRKIQKLKIKKQKLKIIKNHKNLGFAAGINVGIRRAINQDADVVLLLNQDTTVAKNFLKPLMENQADITAPVIKFKRAGEWVYDLGGKVNLSLGRTHHLESDKIEDLGKVDYVSGCAMLIKRPVFEKIGLLDKRFFLYFEDVDFCLRAKKAGFKIAVEPKSVVLHKLIEGKKKPFKQQFHLLKSNLIFIKHHVPFWKKPVAVLYWWLLTVKTLIGRLK